MSSLDYPSTELILNETDAAIDMKVLADALIDVALMSFWVRLIWVSYTNTQYFITLPFIEDYT